MRVGELAFGRNNTTVRVLATDDWTRIDRADQRTRETKRTTARGGSITLSKPGMRSLWGLAAVGSLVALSEAKLWHKAGESWTPAKETARPLELHKCAGGAPPAPTSAPRPDQMEEELRKRDTPSSVCGYVDGRLSESTRLIWAMVPCKLRCADCLQHGTLTASPPAPAASSTRCRASSAAARCRTPRTARSRRPVWTGRSRCSPRRRTCCRPSTGASDQPLCSKRLLG